eukprot:CAMPEP_0197435042 /NCGR_PEP_ID=MMETSP1175-20131217/2691_1 /TAXON_ID=1003142 /ORGANISM="Triceratium dubium, Strain CCMP147" /LENGTH=408 /DNA_ID=CAMNT_0042963969 /DNA_START=125 /DNA_END=1351 /DNA_ORIENTATION=-
MKVCIVGGGLAGLASAISLSKAFCQQQKGDEENGFEEKTEIIVVERRDFSSRGATFALALNGQAALKEISPSLLEELKEIGIPLPSGSYMLPWYRVRDGLLRQCKESRGVKIISRTSLVSATERDGRVFVTLEEEGNDNDKDGDISTNTTKKELVVDLLLGADGVNSPVRTRVLNGPPAVSSYTKCWRGALNDLPTNLRHVLDNPVAKMIKTETGYFSIFNFNASYEGFISWVATSKDMDAATPLDILDGIENPGDEEMARGLLEISTSLELEFSTILSTIPMEDEIGWGGKGRVTLIGDAAHALRPASGLGGSLAFEDVAVLTRELVKVSEDSGEGEDVDTDIPAALREFESVRFLRCKTILDDQTRIAEAGYGSSDKPPLTWTPEYKEWLFMGPDADPKPPTKIYL